MAREIVLNIYCDLCQEVDGVQTEAEEMPPVQIGTAKPRILAVCKEHKVDFFDKFQEILTDLGVTVDSLANTREGKRKVSRPAPAAAVDTAPRIPCPIPDCDAPRPFKSRGSLQGHLRKQHGTTLNAALEELGQEELLDVNGEVAVPDEERESGPTAPPKVQRAECDQPGCTQVYEWPESTRPTQALSIHKAKTHGIRGASKTTKNRRLANAS